jgi:NAD(P)-dependent dehydrogenase (short-subunit alcohol dehydrogenase family)
MTRVSIVTGATCNLGFSLAQGLARRLEEDDVFI